MDYITERAHVLFQLAHGGGAPSDGDIALYRMYAVLSFAKGKATTAEDVHDAWSAWIIGLYPDHRSLKPFAELSPDVQKMDDLFVGAIRRASGPRIPLTIYAVDQKFGYLGHEIRPIAYFFARASAEHFAAKHDADAIAAGWFSDDGRPYTHRVHELTVDDPDVLAEMGGETG